MKHFNNLMKYSLKASSAPAIRAEVKGNEVLIYVRSRMTCPCCHQVIGMGGESLFRTISLTQYKTIIEHNSLTI